jgi:acetylornithine deacetylase
MTPETSRTVEILKDLVAIPSVNPAYDPSSAGEVEMTRYIERWADQLGLCVTRQPVLDSRPNVVARLMVDPSYPTLLFEAHMDTVGVASNTLGGFEPMIMHGKLYGRGACDTKGSMAAMMVAMEELVGTRDQLACNVEFLAAVDEETIGSGALAYARNSPDVAAAIVGEPTGNRIVNSHRGVIRGRIVLHGRAAHTSVAHEGINAIEPVADILTGLSAISNHLGRGPDGGSLTVSLIEGGTGINIVPDRCTLSYDRRTVPGDSRKSVLAEIDEVLETVRLFRPSTPIDHIVDFDVSPLNTDTGEPVIEVAMATAGDLGLDPAPASVPYGSDASYLHDEAGIPCIVFGPGSIDVAHSADEHVPLPELNSAAQFYQQVAFRFGQSHPSV